MRITTMINKLCAHKLCAPALAFVALATLTGVSQLDLLSPSPAPTVSPPAPNVSRAGFDAPLPRLAACENERRDVLPPLPTSGNGSLVAFWHIGRSQSQGSSAVNRIVREQYAQLVQSQAYQTRGLEVRWVAPGKCLKPNMTISQDVQALLRSDKRFVETPRPLCFDCADGIMTEFYEVPTLLQLHSHCLSHPRDTVAYFHTKTDNKWRQEMMEQVFGEMGDLCHSRCFGDQQQTRKMACGPRVRPATRGPCNNRSPTWCHLSGNFWWARCEYVATLNRPFSEGMMVEAALHQMNLPDIRPQGRFFAEWWLLNDVRNLTIRPMPSREVTVVDDHDATTGVPVLRPDHLVKVMREGCTDENGTACNDENGLQCRKLRPNFEDASGFLSDGGRKWIKTLRMTHANGPLAWPAFCPVAGPCSDGDCIRSNQRNLGEVVCDSSRFG
jgi:hypothetical protein